MSGPPRRRPFPFDGVIAGVAAMFYREPKDSDSAPAELVAVKADTLANIAPSDYAYSAQSPLAEKVAPFGSLEFGYGLKIQQLFQDRRYRKALGVDVTGGVWVKGPNIASVTPTNTGNITKIWKQGANLYAAAGIYVLKSVDGLTWSTQATLAATSTDVQLFQSNAPGIAEWAYIGVGFANNMYRFDGTTATVHGTM